MQDPIYAPEAMLTAAVLSQPNQYDEVRWLDPTLFHDNTNRQVYVAVGWICKDHPKLDPDDLLSRVRILLVEYGKTAALQRLIQLTTAYPAVGVAAPVYARAVHEQHQHDALVAAAVRMNQIVHGDLDLQEKASLCKETWEEVLETVTAEPGWAPISGLHSIPEFLQQGDGTHQWVIPGMLERQERFMLIAPIKAGKTVLTRQVALMLAAGRHPLHPATTVPPMHTLLVDLENPAAVARRDLRRQVEQMDDVWSTENPNCHILHRPAGIHLGDSCDRVLLRQAVERLQVDLICVSPIYKAFDGLDKSWEEQAFGVQKPLDKLREDYNCAIWLEHHAPHSERGMTAIRPFGSSRWGRWLDYQAALVPVSGPPYRRLRWDAVRRDERKLAPEFLRRGELGEQSWVPEWDDSEHGFEMAMFEAEA